MIITLRIELMLRVPTYRKKIKYRFPEKKSYKNNFHTVGVWVPDAVSYVCIYRYKITQIFGSFRLNKSKTVSRFFFFYSSTACAKGDPEQSHRSPARRPKWIRKTKREKKGLMVRKFSVGSFHPPPLPPRSPKRWITTGRDPRNDKSSLIEVTGVTEKNTGNPNRVPGLTLKYRSKQKRAVCLDRIINRGGFSCCPSSRIKPNTRDNVIVRSYSMLCKLMVNHKPLKSSVCNVYRGWSRIFFLRRYDYNVYYPFFFFLVWT